MAATTTTTTTTTRPAFGTTALIDCLKAAGHPARAYSARGMGGKYVVAVPLRDGFDVWQLALELAAFFGPTVALAHEPAVDPLGLDTIAYWRALPWPASEAQGVEE
jgi:hypothetical protein